MLSDSVVIMKLDPGLRWAQPWHLKGSPCCLPVISDQSWWLEQAAVTSLSVARNSALQAQAPAFLDLTS